MKDIDFDELDKAVSSVLGTASKPKTTTVTPEPAPAPDATPVAAVVEPPKPATPAAEAPASAETPAAEPPKIIASPAVRRGRFMDVVHPSSDMKTAPATPTVSTPSSRTLRPVSTDLVAPAPVEAPTPAPEAPTATSTDALVEPATPETTPEETPKLDTIDTPTALDKPIEHTGLAADDDETQPETPAAEEKGEEAKDAEPAIVKPAPEKESPKEEVTPEVELPKDEELEDLTKDIEEAAPQTTDEPKETPFLTDTKVDKRPLGAFAGEEAPVAAADTPEPLPRELDADVLDIESKEAPDEVPKPVETQNVLLSPENTADDAQLQHMFSSETDHALPGGKKKSSIWLWILLLLALLAIGSGLGYLWFVNGF